MSTLGKVLVVLVLVFSVAFAMMAASGYAARSDWQKEAQAFEKRADDEFKLRLAADKRARDAVDGHRKVTDELVIVKRDLKAAKTSLDHNQRKQETETTKYEKRITALVTENTVSARTADRLTLENENLMKTLKDIRAEALQAAKDKANTEGELKVAQRDLANVNKTNIKVNKLLAERTEIIRRLGGPLSLEDLDEKVTPAPPDPPVTGIILRIEDGGQYCMISLGKSDGLKKHHKLIIFRRKPEIDFVGNLEVVTVDLNRAVCKILPGVEEAVKEGYDVTTPRPE